MNKTEKILALLVATFLWEKMDNKQIGRKKSGRYVKAHVKS